MGRIFSSKEANTNIPSIALSRPSPYISSTNISTFTFNFTASAFSIRPITSTIESGTKSFEKLYILGINGKHSLFGKGSCLRHYIFAGLACLYSQTAVQPPPNRGL